MIVIKGIQIKVARVAAGLTHQKLADEAGIAISTLRRVEVESQILTAKVETLDKILSALEKHGVRISNNGDKLIWEMNV
ncbi:MAG: helix-turn-helix transcriptional regulator [Rhizobiales bacterium]|nr:helix-turn-helix transcriptional regulator [Hyphomicrobiales bacterium]